MGSRRPAWRFLVPATALAAGLLFAATATTAHGTDLRAGRWTQLAGLITAQQRQLASQEAQAAALRRAVVAAQQAAATRNGAVAAERARGDALAGPVGLTPVTGPAVTVSLQDAPRPAAGFGPAVNPDSLLVHQQDVQAVVNGLWAGGAEAMTLMGQRMIATSAVRCVGNTVIVQGRVYSPPFVITAIGDPARLQAGLAAEPGVRYFQTFVRRFGLGYHVSVSRSVRLPGYDGTLDLPHVAAS